MSERFHKGDRVKVDSNATDRVKAKARAMKKGYLLGTVLTERDPCCGCHIVEFDVKVGGDASYYVPKPKVGYMDEVEPSSMTKYTGKDKDLDTSKAKAKDTGKVAKDTEEFHIGTTVEISETASDYPAVSLGDRGVVVDIQGGRLGVRWVNSKPGMHTLVGKVDRSHGYWVKASMVKVIDPSLIPMTPVRSGDRIIVVKKGGFGYDGANVGQMGKVLSVDEGSAAVEFDESVIGGHSLGTRLPASSDRGYWIKFPSIRVILHGVPVPVKTEPTPIKNGTKSVSVRTKVRVFTQEGTPISPGSYSGTAAYEGSTLRFIIVPFGKTSGALVFYAGDERIEVLS